MTEAKFEKEVAASVEAKVLQKAIFNAVETYSDFLERHGLIWDYGHQPDDHDFPRLKASALVVTLDYKDLDTIRIMLKDGAIDRVYGKGVNPDPTDIDSDPPLPYPVEVYIEVDGGS